MRAVAFGVIMAALATVLPAGRVWAGEQSPSADGDPTGMFNVDAMIDQAVKNVAARYNLNEKQEQVTRAMMFSEVKRFLNKHQNEIWPLVRSLSAAQVSGKMPEGKEAERIGTAALPLIDEAKRAIIDGNRRWRELAELSTEQQQMHEFDLKEMDKTFSKVKENFDEWKQGKPRDPNFFPQEQNAPLNGEPPRPTKPAAMEKPNENYFDARVARFIREYELTDAQKDTAQSILRDCKTRAADYRKTNADKFAAAETTSMEAARANDSAKVVEATAELKRLNEPIVALFDELNTRLEQIPDSAQREKVKSKSAPKAPVRKQPTSAPAASPPPAAAPASQPNNK